MERKEMDEMIEILGIAIARQEEEEEFFRRSARASENEVSRALFNEIADDLATYRKGLEARRAKLIEALEDLKRAVDPVCGMKVDTTKAKHVSTYKGEKFHFCSADCKRAFEAAPEKYTRGKA